MENLAKIFEKGKGLGKKAMALLLLGILTACGAGKQTANEISSIDFLNCNTSDSANMSVDLPAGSTLKVEGATLETLDGGNLNIDGKSDVSTDGTVTVHQQGQDLIFKGSPGNGKLTHIDITGMCVKPATPTPRPQSTPTPLSYNRHDRMVTMSNGFRGTKSAQVFRRS